MDIEILRIAIRIAFSFIPFFAAVYTLVILVMVGLYVFFVNPERKVNQTGIVTIAGLGYGAWGLLVFWMFYALRVKW